MKNICFVCTGNTCRSPMAMAIFNDYAAKNKINAVADSAGIAAFGDEISYYAAESLKKIGINLNNYRSKMLNTYLIDNSDYIVVMTENHKQILLDNGVDNKKIIVLGNGISDPYGANEQVYFDCMKEIEKAVIELFKRLEL